MFLEGFTIIDWWLDWGRAGFYEWHGPFAPNLGQRKKDTFISRRRFILSPIVAEAVPTVPRGG